MKRETESHIPLEPFYGPEHVTAFEHERDLAEPGEFPFTRGVRRHAPAHWIHRELSGEGDPRRSNEQFRYLLSKGQTGLDVIGDAPTVAMLDPDHPYAERAVGTQGVSLALQDDYVDLLRDLPLDKVSVSASLPPAFAIAGFYAAARELGFDPASLRGSTIQAPLYCEDHGYATHMPFALRVRLAADSIAFATEHMPRFHAFVEDTYYISDAGLDAVEEMALGFVEIRHVAAELVRRGLPIDSFAPRIAILVNCHMDVFETVAKIRATRRLYARMMRELGAVDPRSLAVNITSHTAGSALTAQQPINNVVRGTVQAMALAMAGVQAMEISAFDEAFRTPSAEAHEVGLRTQQIVQLESRVAAVADPLGGSYFIEHLTGELERRIASMIEEIEGAGDVADLAGSGYFRAIFQHAMERRARDLADGTMPKVGLNCFTVSEEEDTLLKSVVERKIAPDRARVEHVRAFRSHRHAGTVEAALVALRDAATQRERNVMPAILAAGTAGATMGEMAGVLREAYGAPYDPFDLVQSPLAGQEGAG